MSKRERDNEEEESDEAEEVLRIMEPPQLTVEEKLHNAQHILRQLVETYKIAEYASIVPLNLCCDGCHQPFIEDEDENHPFDTFDNLSMCSGCIQLARKALSEKKQKN